MERRGVAGVSLLCAVVALWCAFGISGSARQGPGGAPAARQGGPPPGGRRGGGPPQTPQQAASIDLTGYWVSIINEDWRWRMITPPHGDYASVPLNAEGRKIADAWDMAKDVKDGNQCRPFGAAGVMRVPGRLHITWTDPNTLQVDLDAGTQTRVLNFIEPPATAERTWQGRSIAAWESAPGTRGRGAPGPGTLKVVTTMLKAGYLRWNGVPYSEQTLLTEYFDRHGAFGQEWITVTTIVNDPQYLNQLFITTTHFRKEPDGSKWSPTPCETAPPPVAKVG